MSTPPEHAPEQSHDGPSPPLTDIHDAVEGIEGLLVDFEPDGAWEIGTIRFSQEIDQLLPALLEAQKHITSAARDAENVYFSEGARKATYATLESVISATRPHLNAAGLLMLQGTRAIYTTAAASYNQQIKAKEKGVTLGPIPVAEVTTTTAILHAKSCQWMEVTITLRTREDSAQAVGSGTTYGRRYTAQTATALPTEDDDGNAAAGRSYVEPGRQASAAVEARQEPKTRAVPSKEKGIKRLHATWRKLANELVCQTPEGEPDPKHAMKRAFLLGLTKGAVAKGADLTALQADTANERLKNARNETLLWLNNNGPGGWRTILAKYEPDNAHPVIPLTPEEETAANESDARKKADSAITAIIDSREPNPDLSPEDQEANRQMIRLAIYRHYTSRQHEGPDTMTPDQALGFAEILSESTAAIVDWLEHGQWLKEVGPEDRKAIVGDEDAPDEAPAEDGADTPITEEEVKVPF